MIRFGPDLRFACFFGLVAFGVGCGQRPTVSDRASSLRSRFDLRVPGPIPYPPDNGPRNERIDLGRLLFFDPILGGERDVSCGACHHPDFAFSDGRQFAAGVSGSGVGRNRVLSQSSITGLPVPETPRNTQTILNTAFSQDEFGQPSHLGPMFWDGRSIGLEGQALVPMVGREEMRGDAFPGTDTEAAAVALDSIIARLRAIPAYTDLFLTAFPEEALGLGTIPEAIITRSTLSRAIAAYERELVTLDSPYDRFAHGDDAALSALQMDGLEVFFSKGKCFLCHAAPTFSSFGYFVTGVPTDGVGKSVIPGDDTGREEHTMVASDRYRFRAPSLRNIELTSPYMHAGVFGTLDDVVRFYNEGAQPRHPGVQDLDLEVALQDPLGLTESEVGALLNFLRSLTGIESAADQALRTIPTSVPSGLPPVVGVGGGSRR